MANPQQKQIALAGADEAITNALIRARLAAEALDRGPGGREVALASTKLQEAQMWLHEAEVQAHMAQVKP